MPAISESPRTWRFGIEIELVNISRPRAQQAMLEVLGGVPGRESSYDNHYVIAPDGRKWCAKSDASLTGYVNNAAEIVSPILVADLGTDADGNLTIGGADLEMVQKLVRKLRSRTYKAKADRSCGVHVHLDSAPLEAAGVVNLTNMIFQQEDLILKALAVQEHRSNPYNGFCRPTPVALIERLRKAKPKTLAELGDVWYGHHQSYMAQDEARRTHYGPGRYSGLNLHSVWYRGTVELRWFEGTTHAGKIKSYVQFAVALACKSRAARTILGRKRPYSEASAKYDFRCFLLRLGMIGDGFATARHHLLVNLPGDAARKSALRPSRAREARPVSGPLGATAAQAIGNFFQGDPTHVTLGERLNRLAGRVAMAPPPVATSTVYLRGGGRP